MRLSKKLGKKVHRNKIVVVNALKMTYVNRGIVRIGANLLLRLAKIQPSKEGVCSMKCPTLPKCVEDETVKGLSWTPPKRGRTPAGLVPSISLFLDTQAGYSPAGWEPRLNQPKSFFGPPQGGEHP